MTEYRLYDECGKAMPWTEGIIAGLSTQESLGINSLETKLELQESDIPFWTHLVSSTRLNIGNRVRLYIETFEEDPEYIEKIGFFAFQCLDERGNVTYQATGEDFQFHPANQRPPKIVEEEEEY